MASIRLIRRRIKSAQNIAQITRAMQMVAASKMKKAQELASQGKLYADKIYTATRELAGRTESTHPLLGNGNAAGKPLVVLISTNKGLCGGLNTTLFRQFLQWFPRDAKTDVVALGKKGASFVVRSGASLSADFSDTMPFAGAVPAITQMVVNGFTAGTYREIHVVYSGFVNALKQEPVRKLLLPLTGFSPDELKRVKDEGLYFSEFVIEPGVDDVLSTLLPHYLENQLRSAILEAEASEHSARMIAMKNATDAALDFQEALTLLLNKARQEKITYEIADMVTARMAVGG